MFAKKLDKEIKKTIDKILSKRKVPNEPKDIIVTDTLAELIDKLIILHIRNWMLEDKIYKVINNDKKYSDIKRKLDILFKIKRPRLLEAINRTINDAIINNKSLFEENFKIYKNILKEK